MRRKSFLLAGTLALSIASLFFASCTALKTSSPIFPIKEYEKMLVGPLDAQYIGNDNCLKACHEHDQNALYLSESVHGQQTDTGTGMPLVNCETCHGPGSLAVAHAEENKKCDTSQFVNLKELPAGAQSLLCLKCHSSHSMSNMQYWPISQHAQADISCSNCHKLHKGPRQKLEGTDLNKVCYGCHRTVQTEFSLFSRHPMKEGKMTCANCHEPHGSIQEDQLAAADIKGVCINCHAEKTGPFVYEHGDLMDECSGCHNPHGSAFSGLLKYQQPFLCLECHSGHAPNRNPTTPSIGYRRGYFTKCTSCHSQIHGTDTKGDPTMPSSTFMK